MRFAIRPKRAGKKKVLLNSLFFYMPLNRMCMMMNGSRVHCGSLNDVFVVRTQQVHSIGMYHRSLFICLKLYHRAVSQTPTIYLQRDNLINRTE